MLSTLVQRVNTRISPEPGFSRVLSDTLGNARLHAIDAAFLDTILNYELIIYTTCETGPNYFLKFAMLQMTRAAPAQKDAGGTVDE